MQAAIAAHGAKWAERIAQVESKHSAILPSEMLAFCCVAEHLEVEHIVESGRKFGFSTDVLAMGTWDIMSIDWDPETESDKRFAGDPRITLMRGSGEVLVPRFATDRCAVLLDGPKGLLALSVYQDIYQRVAFAAIHDLHHGAHIRDYVLSKPVTCWMTDEPEFSAEWGHIDKEHLTFIRQPSRENLFKTGNVLGIFPGGANGTL